MLLDLKFSIGTLGLATGTLFSALYGMNLKNFIEESDFGFGGVSVICFAMTGVVCMYGLSKLRKLQRVRMWGESGAGGNCLSPLTTRHGAVGGHRTNWRADSIEPVWSSLPGEGRSERIKRLRDNAAAAAAYAASRTPGTAFPNSAVAAAAAAAKTSTPAFEDALNTEGTKAAKQSQKQGTPHDTSRS